MPNADTTTLYADLNHVVPVGTPGSFLHTFVRRLDNGEHLTVGPTSTPIHDLRLRLSRGDKPKIDVEGFAVEEHVYEGLDKPQSEWENDYMTTMQKWLREYLGAKEVFMYSCVVRRQKRPSGSDQPKEYDGDKAEPALVCHVDLAQRESLTKASANLGLTPAEVKEKGLRIGTINVWRPLRGPVMDCPLAVMDARGLRTEDTTITHDKFGDGTFIAAAPERHEWSYIRDQMPNELLLFRCYDSDKGYDEGGCTPHSAFIDQARSGPEWPTRESVELRCNILY